LERWSRNWHLQFSVPKGSLRAVGAQASLPAVRGPPARSLFAC
jgi:hypothetical protein